MTRKLFVLVSTLLFFVFCANVQAISTGNVQMANPTRATDAAAKLKIQTQLVQEQQKTAVLKAREEMRLVIQAKRDEFKNRIQTIKDQKKKALIERIDARLSEVNEKHTARYTAVLGRLRALVEKRKQSEENNAKILEDITIAENTITLAESAVQLQAEKDYIMTITDDSTLRLNAGTAVKQLRQDLIAVYKLVIDAKQTVQKLNTYNETFKNEATDSAQNINYGSEQ